MRESLVNLRTRFAYAQIGVSSADAPGRRGKGYLCLQEPVLRRRRIRLRGTRKKPVVCERKT
jgi:hypothetical protein